MKKSLLVLAALSAFTGLVSAQSSVTLSGTVDAGVRRVGTVVGGVADNDYRFAGSQSGYNAITFSGVEDLGGGSRAFFSLNHRFAVGNGTVNGTTNTAGTDPFWRQAWVGLGSSFGDVRLGRMLVPLQDINGAFDPFATGTVGSTHTGGIAATIRSNNTIYYRSPSLGGLVIHAAIAESSGQNQGTDGLGEIANPGSATFRSAQSYFVPTARLATGVAERPAGVQVRYTAGPIDVGVAYDRNAADLKTTGVYAAYNFGFMKLMGQFEKGDSCTVVALALPAATACTTTATGAEDIKAMSIGATAPLGAFLLRAGFLRIDSNLTGEDASKIGFGGDYNLSKRTNLYATVGKWRGDRFATGSTAAYANAVKRTMFDVGVTHRF